VALMLVEAWRRGGDKASVADIMSVTVDQSSDQSEKAASCKHRVLVAEQSRTLIGNFWRLSIL
jgi:hypothetical protein